MILGPYLTRCVARTRQEIAELTDKISGYEIAADKARRERDEARWLLDELLKDVVEKP